MVRYHRIGNMEGRLGNAAPTTSLHELYWWKSPRWIVIRIEALAMVAIIISFFLAAFGSCRRWSNSWIVQKGFFAAQVLSLSLGTYSIGLMQSSSVKSEMYPIWTVSLFTLFGCIDPVTTYNGLDFKGPLSKAVFGICLNCGYVLLMSISTISNVIGNAAIITLSVITFFKGFHRSFALVLQNRMQDWVSTLNDFGGEACIFRKDYRIFKNVLKEITVNIDTGDSQEDIVTQDDIEVWIKRSKHERLQSCYDVCIAFSLSHRLQRHFLGLGYRVAVARPQTLKDIDYKWAFTVIEIELAFLYDIFFTGNPFLYYYQAKTASLWALASFTGICFVLVGTAIPGVMTSRRLGTSGGWTKVVDTTTADLAITFCILVSLALLQLMQLVRSWTSNWARAAVACRYARKEKSAKQGDKLSGWMRLKAFVVTSTNLFDTYLWQDKISQYSILPEPRLVLPEPRSENQDQPGTGGNKKGEGRMPYPSCSKAARILRRRCVDLVRTLGLHYVWQVIWELLSIDTCKRGGVKLEEDVKGSVIDFLDQIQSDQLDGIWLSSLPEEPEIRYFLPHISDPRLLTKPGVHCYRYTFCVMTWHIVTWYCELAEQTNYFQRRRRGGKGGTKTRDHRRVANALSQYCVYLVKFAPELLPGPVAWTKQVYKLFVRGAYRMTEVPDKDSTVEGMSKHNRAYIDWYGWAKDIECHNFPLFAVQNGETLAKLLMHSYGPDEIWKTLARVWVQLLVYAAPYGNVEGHMRHLSQGGEFITHLWALLYHLDVHEWKVQGTLFQITSIEDAMRILAEDDQAIVVAFVDQNSTEQDEVAAASRLVDGVKYYYTSELYVFKSLVKTTRFKFPDLVFLKKEANNLTFHEGEFRAYHIAHFVQNQIALAQDPAQAQSSEDDDRGQSEAMNEEELHNTIRQKMETKNLQNITTVDDAKMITIDDLIVVAFVRSLSGPHSDMLATASKLEDGVRFYQTSSPDVARHFHIDPEAGDPALVLLNKEANEFTLYGTASSSVDSAIKKQSSEDEIAKVSSGDEIMEEIDLNPVLNAI